MMTYNDHILLWSLEETGVIFSAIKINLVEHIQLTFMSEAPTRYEAEIETNVSISRVRLEY